MDKKSENSLSREQEQALKTVAKGAGIIFFGMVFARITRYATRIILARYLGPDSYGLLYFSLSLVFLITSLILFGLPTALERYISIFHIKKNKEKIKGVILSSFEISLPVAITVSFFLFLFSDKISFIIFKDNSLSFILKIISLIIPFNVILNLSIASTRGFQTAKYDVLIQKVLNSIITFIIILILVPLGFGVVGGALGYLISDIITSLLSFLYLHKKFIRFSRKFTKFTKFKKELISYSWPIMMAGMVWLLLGQIDVIMMGFMLKSPIDLGIYQTALPTAGLISIFTLSLISLFVPVLSGLYSKRKTYEIISLYQTISKWGFYLTFPISFVLIFFPNIVINTFFGPKYLAGSIPLSILSIGLLINSLGIPSSKMIDVLGKTKFHFLNTTLVVSLDIILNCFLIPRYGVIGAAIATTSSFIFFTFLRIIEVYYILKVPPLSTNFIKTLILFVVNGMLFYFFEKSVNEIIHISLQISLVFTLSILLLSICRDFNQNDIFMFKLIKRKFIS